MTSPQGTLLRPLSLHEGPRHTASLRGAWVVDTQKLPQDVWALKHQL